MGPWILLVAYLNTEHSGRDHEGLSFRWFWDSRPAGSHSLPCVSNHILFSPYFELLHGSLRGDLCFPFSIPGFLSSWAAKAVFPSSLGEFFKSGCCLLKGILREWWPMAAKQIWAGWLLHEVIRILHGVVQNGTNHLFQNNGFLSISGGSFE